MTDGPQGKLLVIKEHGSENLRRVDIKTEKVQGEDLFFTGPGISGKSILGLVQKVRRVHKLYCPINEPDDKDDSDDEDRPEKASGEESDEDDDEEKLDRESHNAYFWGDITSEEAEKKLENNHPGTFLLRQNGDLFKLSWISFNNRNYHAHITEQLGFFALGNRRFRTLCELVTFHQNQPHNFKNALGGPLINPKYEENKTEEEKDLERNDSRNRKLSSLQGFHGTINAKDAESMLQKERDASYLVRKNPAGMFFISYRHNNRVYHLPIEEDDKKYTIKFPDEEGGIVIA